jgi:hypothetical protein
VTGTSLTLQIKIRNKIFFGLEKRLLEITNAIPLALHRILNSTAELQEIRFGAQSSQERFQHQRPAAHKPQLTFRKCSLLHPMILGRSQMETQVATIERDELKQKMDRKDHFFLVETLAPEYFNHAHLPGAINLPPDRVREMAPKLLPEKTADIVVYCAKPT